MNGFLIRLCMKRAVYSENEEIGRHKGSKIKWQRKCLIQKCFVHLITHLRRIGWMLSNWRRWQSPWNVQWFQQNVEEVVIALIFNAPTIKLFQHFYLSVQFESWTEKHRFDLRCNQKSLNNWNRVGSSLSSIEMMRPSSLYRSDSRREPTIEASANNIHEGVSLSLCEW